jgi:hypothetical protein
MVLSIGLGSPLTNRKICLAPSSVPRSECFLRASVVYAKLVTTPSTVYVIGLTKSLASKTLHVSSLSTSTGELVTTTNIPLTVAVGLSDVLVVSSDAAIPIPRVVWLEAGTIRSIELVPNLTNKPTSVTGSTYTGIVDIGLQSKGHFVALTVNGTGRIHKLDVDKLKVLWDFPDSVSSLQNSSLVLSIR